MWVFFQHPSASPLVHGFRRHWRSSLVESNGKLFAAFYDPNNPSSLALFRLDYKFISDISIEALWEPISSLDVHQSWFLNLHSSLLVKGPRGKEDAVVGNFPGNQAFFSMVVGDSNPVPARLICTERGMFFIQSNSEAARGSFFPRCHRKADPVVCSIGSDNVNRLLSGANNHKELPNSVWIVPAIDLSNANNHGDVFSMPNGHMLEPDCVAREEDNVGEILDQVNQLHLTDSTTGNQTLSCHLSPWAVYLHGEKKSGKGQETQFPNMTFVSAVDGRCYIRCNYTDAFKKSPGKICSRVLPMAMTPQGWMVFQMSEKPKKLLLVNPVSQEHIPLPPLPCKELFYFDLAIPPQGFNNRRINIVAACKDTKELLRYELGGKTNKYQWQRHRHDQNMVVGLATCSLSGRRVYIFNHECRLDCMDLDHASRGFTKIADPLTPEWHLTYSRHLIESHGELFVIFRERGDSDNETYPTIFRLYKMDFANSRWIAITYTKGCLRGRAFFFGEMYWSGGFAVRANGLHDKRLTPGSSQLQEDCVYFFRTEDNRFYCYNMEDESISVVGNSPEDISSPWNRLGWIPYPKILYSSLCS